jgi:superfamily II DNA or RNA helicase
VHLLTEGFDLPALECVVLARGFSHVGSYLQAVGRALRPAPEKRHATVLDLGGSVHEHGLPDEDREYSLAGRPIRPSERVEPVRQCRWCGAVFAAPGTDCPRCGRPVARPLTRAQQQERREALQRVRDAHPADRRAEAFRELQQRAAARGYKPGWAAMRYRARYGCWPGRAAG